MDYVSCSVNLNLLGINWTRRKLKHFSCLNSRIIELTSFVSEANSVSVRVTAYNVQDL